MAKGKYQEWLTDDGQLLLRSWARDGLNNAQIAQKMGVSYTTFKDWAVKYPAFSAALKKGREPVAAKIEEAFYSKCEWNTYDEVRDEVTTNADGSTTTKHIVIKHPIPPDTAALIFALKNLRADRFRANPVPVNVDSETKHSALIDAIKGLSDD